MIFFYVIPMILCLLFLYYMVNEPQFEATNGGVLALGIAAFIPLVNIVVLIPCCVFWFTISKWVNKPFTKPSFLSKSRS